MSVSIISCWVFVFNMTYRLTDNHMKEANGIGKSVPVQAFKGTLCEVPFLVGRSYLILQCGGHGIM